MSFGTGHIWLVAALVWLVLGWVPGLGPARYARDRQAGEALFKRVGAGLAVALTTLWLIQLSAGPGAQAPIHLWPTPQRWLGFGVAALTFLAAALWVFAGSGAHAIATAFALSETKAKAAFALLLIAAVLMNVYVANATPPS